MTNRWLGTVLGAVILSAGCATSQLPGAAGEVSGPLLSLELYAGRPEHRVPYCTVWRERLSASDRDVYVGLFWNLPAPGNYVTRIALWTPAGTMHSEQESRFRADTSTWFMWHPVALPHGDEAQQLAGAWQVDVSLDGTPVGRRTFVLEPGNIRLRTEARLVILQGSDDPEVAAGDWIWLDRAAALEAVKAAHATLGVVLHDELARRFPHVDGPRQPPAGPDATVVVRSNLTVSPSPDTDARLALDVVDVATNTTRTFRFRSSAGIEQLGATRRRDDRLAAAHLAFQAAADPEVLEYLAKLARAVPE